MTQARPDHPGAVGKAFRREPDLRAGPEGTHRATLPGAIPQTPTPREIEVLATYIRLGHWRAVSKELQIGRSTVLHHIKNLRERTPDMPELPTKPKLPALVYHYRREIEAYLAEAPTC